ncbi:MAG: HPr family phosphocarrier protein [bacterium]|nr:HPr family phosphocarrier protein [bacterium]
MVKEEIISVAGLHARPATALVKEARKFESDIVLEKDGERANAKSIIGILSLEVSPGSVIVLEVNGSDEAKCFEELSRFIRNGMKR